MSASYYFKVIWFYFFTTVINYHKGHLPLLRKHITIKFIFLGKAYYSVRNYLLNVVSFTLKMNITQKLIFSNNFKSIEKPFLLLNSPH